MHSHLLGCHIYFYDIIILYQGNVASQIGLRHYVTNYKTVRAPTESAICNQCNRFSQSRTNDGRSRLQHFWHAWSTFRAHIPNYYYITCSNFSGVDAFNQFEFAIKNPSWSGKHFSFLTAYFCYTTSGCEIAI